MTSNTIKFCKIPSEVSPDEASIYKTLIRSHCDHAEKGEDNHKCVGVLSISVNSIVLRCKKCGDARGNYK